MDDMRKVIFTCDYESFLEWANLQNNKESQKIWLNVVAEINTQHHEIMLDEINQAIAEIAGYEQL
jgi:hypothetical protein